MTEELRKFIEKFSFREEMSGFVGIEREWFLLDKGGEIVPRSKNFLDAINDLRWTYELSACQAEDRIIPQKDPLLVKLELLKNRNSGDFVAKKLGLRLDAIEVAPEAMPLDVYPEPRYIEIAGRLPKEKLVAACRVTGTHIHLGVGNLEKAFLVYRALAARTNFLSQAGDHTNGLRLALYKTVLPNCEPPIYENVDQFFETARREGFAENPRNCWHLVRISRHGTVECRMFGTTPYEDEVIEWVNSVKNIAKETVGA